MWPPLVSSLCPLSSVPPPLCLSVWRGMLWHLESHQHIHKYRYGVSGLVVNLWFDQWLLVDKTAGLQPNTHEAYVLTLTTWQVAMTRRVGLWLSRHLLDYNKIVPFFCDFQVWNLCRLEFQKLLYINFKPFNQEKLEHIVEVKDYFGSFTLSNWDWSAFI